MCTHARHANHELLNGVAGGHSWTPGRRGRWTCLSVPTGTQSGRVWGRKGCSFSDGSGSCQTGDCGGVLSCTLSGELPI